MAKTDDIIKWQFPQEFYKSKNTALDQASMLLVTDQFEPAFNILKFIFLSIGNEVNNKFPERYEKMKKATTDINGLTIVFNRYASQSNIPSRIKMRKMSELMYQMKEQIDYYYEELHNLLWDLNMLVPKGKGDPSLPIYQQ